MRLERKSNDKEFLGSSNKHFSRSFSAPPPNSPHASAAAATTQNDQENSFFHSADSFRKKFFNYDLRYQQSQLKLILFTFSFKIHTKCVNIFESISSCTQHLSTSHLHYEHTLPLLVELSSLSMKFHQGKTLSRHPASAKHSCCQAEVIIIATTEKDSCF